MYSKTPVGICDNCFEYSQIVIADLVNNKLYCYFCASGKPKPADFRHITAQRFFVQPELLNAQNSVRSGV